MSTLDGFGETNPAHQIALSGQTDWKLIKYRVDFKPDVDRTFPRKMLVRAVRQQLPKYMFDGSIMLTTQPLNNDKSPVVLTTRRKSDDTLIQITITEVDGVVPKDHQYMQFFNNVLRQCQEKLNQELLGRNYYDPAAAKIREDFKLELWAEYITSIRQNENDIQLCCEVSTKAQRMDTVLDQLKECYMRDSKNFMTNVTKMILGSIVITTYNSKTYLINEICWDKTANDTIELKDGSKMTFKKYYEHKYNCEISDPFQPLLMSLPKREARGGDCSPVYLVPELCKLSKAMAESLESLNINETSEIEQLLSDWNIQFTKELERFNASVSTPEMIFGGGNSTATYQEENANWGNAFQSNKRKWQGRKRRRERRIPRQQTKSQMDQEENADRGKEFLKWQIENPIGKRTIIHPPRDEGANKDDISSLVKVAPSLGQQFGEDENFEKLKQSEDEKQVVGCSSKFKAFVKKQWERFKRMVGCLPPNADLEKILSDITSDVISDLEKIREPNEEVRECIKVRVSSKKRCHIRFGENQGAHYSEWVGIPVK